MAREELTAHANSSHERVRGARNHLRGLCLRTVTMIDQSFAADLSRHPLGSMALAFGGGVLASLSPCLYPMIPITVSIIGGTGETSRRGRFALALVYVAGLAAVYSGLGLLAGLTGTLF